MYYLNNIFFYFAIFRNSSSVHLEFMASYIASNANAEDINSKRKSSATGYDYDELINPNELDKLNILMWS